MWNLRRYHSRPFILSIAFSNTTPKEDDMRECVCFIHSIHFDSDQNIEQGVPGGVHFKVMPRGNPLERRVALERQGKGEKRKRVLL